MNFQFDWFTLFFFLHIKLYRIGTHCVNYDGIQLNRIRKMYIEWCGMQMSNDRTNSPTKCTIFVSIREWFWTRFSFAYNVYQIFTMYACTTVHYFICLMVESIQIKKSALIVYGWQLSVTVLLFIHNVRGSLKVAIKFTLFNQTYILGYVYITGLLDKKQMVC